MFKQSISATVLLAFLVTAMAPLPKAKAQSLLGLPEPGTMVSLSAAYQPAMIKGITVHQENPFLFDFLVDAGQDNLQGEALKAEGDKLIKYFMATLAIPEKDLWVNLSPYEKDRTVPLALGQTDMGRDLLAQDYMLKQITASLIYPEKELGKKFWDNIYKQTQAKYGNVNIPVNTFNKVWIMADKAEVFEHNQTAFVTESHLKVMLEEDYLAANKNTIEGKNMPDQQAGRPLRNTEQSQIIRAIILPELEKEVNQGKNFANLRQIFNSIILASWYKNNLKQSLLNEVYTDKEKVKGIDIADKTIKEQIYQRYLQAYKKGVFNYIKEDNTKKPNVTTPKKYFSGGVDEGMAARPIVIHRLNPKRNSVFGALQRLVVSLVSKTGSNNRVPPESNVVGNEEMSPYEAKIGALIGDLEDTAKTQDLGNVDGPIYVLVDTATNYSLDLMLSIYNDDRTSQLKLYALGIILRAIDLKYPQRAEDIFGLSSPVISTQDAISRVIDSMRNAWSTLKKTKFNEVPKKSSDAAMVGVRPDQFKELRHVVEELLQSPLKVNRVAESNYFFRKQSSRPSTREVRYVINAPVFPGIALGKVSAERELLIRALAQRFGLGMVYNGTYYLVSLNAKPPSSIPSQNNREYYNKKGKLEKMIPEITAYLSDLTQLLSFLILIKEKSSINLAYPNLDKFQTKSTSLEEAKLTQARLIEQIQVFRGVVTDIISEKVSAGEEKKHDDLIDESVAWLVSAAKSLGVKHGWTDQGGLIERMIAQLNSARIKKDDTTTTYQAMTKRGTNPQDVSSDNKIVAKPDQIEALKRVVNTLLSSGRLKVTDEGIILDYSDSNEMQLLIEALKKRFDLNAVSKDSYYVVLPKDNLPNQPINNDVSKEILSKITSYLIEINKELNNPNVNGLFRYVLSEYDLDTRQYFFYSEISYKPSAEDETLKHRDLTMLRSDWGTAINQLWIAVSKDNWSEDGLAWHDSKLENPHDLKEPAIIQSVLNLMRKEVIGEYKEKQKKTRLDLDLYLGMSDNHKTSLREKYKAWLINLSKELSGIDPDWFNNKHLLPLFTLYPPDWAMTNGGIDLQGSSANTIVRKDGSGVGFVVDRATIERVRREGIESLTPVILRIEPSVNILSLLGLIPPKK